MNGFSTITSTATWPDPPKNGTTVQITHDPEGWVVLHERSGVAGVGDSLTEALADFGQAVRGFQAFYADNAERLHARLAQEADALIDDFPREAEEGEGTDGS